MILGLVNVVKCCCPDRARGASGLATLAAAAALVAMVALAYRAAGHALVGVQESTHAANVVVGWLVGGGLACGLTLTGAALFVGRRRRAREAPIEAAFTAKVDAALERRREALALPSSAARPVPLRVEARRVDEPGGLR